MFLSQNTAKQVINSFDSGCQFYECFILDLLGRQQRSSFQMSNKDYWETKLYCQSLVVPRLGQPKFEEGDKKKYFSD